MVVLIQSLDWIFNLVFERRCFFSPCYQCVGLVLTLVGGFGCGRVGFDHLDFLCSGA